VSSARRVLRRCPHRSPTSGGRGPDARRRALDRPLGVPAVPGVPDRSSCALVRTFERCPATPPSVTIHRLPDPRGPRIMPEGVPLQSLSRLPGWPTVWRSAPTSRGSLALQRHPSTGPRMQQTVRVHHGSDPGVSHPLAGFLARSSSRVCFTPLPSLGSRLPSERSPRVQVAHPSSGPLAPLSFFPVEPRCGARGLVALDLHRLGRRSGVVPGRILSELEAPFQRRARTTLRRPPRDTSRSPWTSHAGLTSVRPFRRLRSVLPCASPFTPRCSHLRRGGRCSPGRPRPSRALLPPSLGPSHPPRPEASLLPLAARASRRDARPPGSPCSGHFSWLAPRALRCWRPSMSGGLRVDDRNVLRSVRRRSPG